MSRTESDENLMANVARGERAPLETLVRRYASPLLTFIVRMVGNLHRSEEVFQEVFVAVWDKRSQYQFPRTFKTWLFAIATNKCRADFRKVQHHTTSLSAPELSSAAITDSPGPLETMIAAETAEKVAQIVTQLPEQQRTVTVLRIWQEMSYAEIADVMQCAEGTVRSHLHHALANLRPRLTTLLQD